MRLKAKLNDAPVRAIFQKVCITGMRRLSKRQYELGLLAISSFHLFNFCLSNKVITKWYPESDFLRRTIREQRFGSLTSLKQSHCTALKRKGCQLKEKLCIDAFHLWFLRTRCLSVRKWSLIQPVNSLGPSKNKCAISLPSSHSFVFFSFFLSLFL